MAYKKEIYTAAQDTLSNRRRNASLKSDEMKMKFHSVCPKAREIDMKIKSTGSKAALAVMRGGSVRSELDKLKEENLNLQKEYLSLLNKNGLTKEDISPSYYCKICEDVGNVDGKACSCYKELLRQLSYEELNRATPIENSGFEHFNTSYYADFEESHKRRMINIINYGETYAFDFSLQSPSLLFQGGTGLGKTHLSLAIAKEAIKKGYGVIYGSVHNFAVSLEKERFESPDDSDTNSLLCSCDLLILDDLGTEFSSSYANSVVYNIINSRIMKKLPTIISTNLNEFELEKKYSERLISRLYGSYHLIGFVGKDIRPLKKMRGELI